MPGALLRSIYAPHPPHPALGRPHRRRLGGPRPRLRRRSFHRELHLRLRGSGPGLRAHRHTPEPFWTTESPERPHRAHLINPQTPAGGVIQLSAAETDLLRTSARSLTVPPGILVSGSTYVFTISAVRNPGVNYAAYPFRSAFPYASSPISSAIVAP